MKRFFYLLLLLSAHFCSYSQHKQAALRIKGLPGRILYDSSLEFNLIFSYYGVKKLTVPINPRIERNKKSNTDIGYSVEYCRKGK